MTTMVNDPIISSPIFFVMEPTTFEQISTKIAELNALLDTANAQALSAKEVSAKQKLSAKMAAAFDNILPELQAKPTLYADRFDRKQLADWKNTYNSAPTLTRDMENCINKMEGLRISTGQVIADKMNKLYKKLGADVVDAPDLKPLYNVFVELYKRGPRKGNGDTDTKGEKDASNENSNAPASPTN